MNVVVDSNQIFTNPMMVSPQWLSLWEYLDRTDSQLLVPEIVYKEACANHLRRCQKLKGDIVEGELELKALAGQDSNFEPDPPEKATAYYKSRWDELKRKGLVSVLPNPSNDVLPELVKRAVEHVPPFNESGSGFRDSLLWYSLRDYLEGKSQEVAFISNDRKAFWENKKVGKLHPALVKELGKAKLTFFTELSAFLDAKANVFAFIEDAWVDALVAKNAKKIEASMLSKTLSSRGLDALNKSCKKDGLELVGTYDVLEAIDLETGHKFVVERDSGRHLLYVEVSGSLTVEAEAVNAGRSWMDSEEDEGRRRHPKLETVSVPFYAEVEFEFSGAEDVEYLGVSSSLTRL